MNRRTDRIVPASDAGLSFIASWMEFWMMPVTIAAQMIGVSGRAMEDEPEIDRDRGHCQLPVPNSHQKQMDHDLFA